MWRGLGSRHLHDASLSRIPGGVLLCQSCAKSGERSLVEMQRITRGTELGRRAFGEQAEDQFRSKMKVDPV